MKQGKGQTNSTMYSPQYFTADSKCKTNFIFKVFKSNNFLQYYARKGRKKEENVNAVVV